MQFLSNFFFYRKSNIEMILGRSLKVALLDIIMNNEVAWYLNAIKVSVKLLSALYIMESCDTSALGHA